MIGKKGVYEILDDDCVYNKGFGVIERRWQERKIESSEMEEESTFW